MTTLESGGPGVPAGSKVYVLRKPANAWSSKSKKGADLSWDGLRARAREFLFLEGTFHALADDNADHVLALIEGDDRRGWHARPDWKAKEDKAGKGPVTTFDGWRVTAVNLANTARATVAASNGQQVLRTVKNKDLRFGPPAPGDSGSRRVHRESANRSGWPADAPPAGARSRIRGSTRPPARTIRRTRAPVRTTTPPRLTLHAPLLLHRAAGR